MFINNNNYKIDKLRNNMFKNNIRCLKKCIIVEFRQDTNHQQDIREWWQFRQICKHKQSRKVYKRFIYKE